MAANRQDVRNIGSQIFPSTLDPRVQKMVIELENSPSTPVVKPMSGEFAMEELLDARKVIFDSAKKKYCEGIQQDGAETTGDSATQKLSTISDCDLSLKARRSPATAADDIKELCLYLFGHRKSFPKSCLSSLSQPKAKQATQQATITDVVTEGPNPVPVPSKPVTLNLILQAIVQVQSDIKSLDRKFSDQISALSDQIYVSSLSERETIRELRQECDALRSTIDMLMSPCSRGADVHSKPPPCVLSRNQPSATTGQAPAVPTTNRFAALATEDAEPVIVDNSTDDPRTEAELLIDSYFEALQPNVQQGKEQKLSPPPAHNKPGPSTKSASFDQQLAQYRKKHKERAAKDKPPCYPNKQVAPNEEKRADILVIGDSMIKRLQPRRLSRQKKVICHTMRGAKIDDLASCVTHLSTKHNVSEIILHVGTNNTSDDPGSIAAKITSLGESLKPRAVTISSIIHRRNQSPSQHKKVDDANNLLKSAAAQNSWGFIDNGNINSAHLVSDGVHLNSTGVRLLARNIIQHITDSPNQNSPCTPRQRTPFGKALYSEVLKKRTTGDRDVSTVFRKANQFYPYPHRKQLLSNVSQPRHSMTPIRTPTLHYRNQEWNQYLQIVRQMFHPQNEGPQ